MKTTLSNRRLTLKTNKKREQIFALFYFFFCSIRGIFILGEKP